MLEDEERGGPVSLWSSQSIYNFSPVYIGLFLTPKDSPLHTPKSFSAYTSMLSSSGLISSLRRSFPRSIDSKVSSARLRAARAKQAQSPVPVAQAVRFHAHLNASQTICVSHIKRRSFWLSLRNLWLFSTNIT